MTLAERLRRAVKGDVDESAATRALVSRDTSIFERTPAVVVFPKDADDVAAVVALAHEARERGEDVSVAARSAGTDMTGGPLTDSIALVCTRYMNRITDIRDDDARAEPGAYYRDYEKAVLEKTGKITPSYPASRNLCAIGGMVSNDSGGELTLRYGKTHQYVREMDVVLSDGSRATFRPLLPEELEDKKSLPTLEGEIYRRTHQLLRSHAGEIAAAHPNVTKNSAGYALWRVLREDGTFDLSQLIAGSQGTLALITGVRLGLVKPKEHRAMLVVFLADIGILPEIVKRTLALAPESFESYDDHTFKLAVRFAPQIVSHFGIGKMLRMGLSFLPETWMALTGGVPKLVLMAEFAEDTPAEALEKVRDARVALRGLAVRTKIARSETETAKYWAIRRESFALLRKNMRGLHASSFIEDIVVHPDDYPRFLPELTALLEQHHLIYTVAGHIGDANFHIIPLMDLSKESQRREILELTPKVFSLVAKYKGSITGEHNDGIIRTPFLSVMYGERMCEIFAEVKKIFDPLGVLNPGKKVGGTVADIERSMIRGT